MSSNVRVVTDLKPAPAKTNVPTVAKILLVKIAVPVAVTVLASLASEYAIRKFNA